MTDITKFFKNKSYKYKVSVEDLLNLWNKQTGKCALCGDELKFDSSTHIDHIIAKTKGGLNIISNYQFTCEDCNYAKRGLDTKDFITLCLKITNYNFELLSKEEKQKIIEQRWKRESKK